MDEALVTRLRRHVDRLAGAIGPRHLGKPAAFHAAAAFVEHQLADAGYNVTREVYRVRREKVANVVAELPGGGRKHEVVILGAHYDTVETTPGADDNASGVSVLIEVAQQLRRLQPPRTVRFVAFACEEPPYFFTGDMGSQVHARLCRQRGEQVRGMLCLEMVGYFSTEPGSQAVPSAIPKFVHKAQRGDFLAAAANLRSWRLLRRFSSGFKSATSLPLFSIALPESVAEIRLSDNSSFWDQGYQALMLTDTSFLRNRHYHLTTDTPETLDYKRMAQVAIGVAGGTLAVAGGAK